MKNVLVVGNSNEMQQIFSMLIMGNIGTCIHANNIISAIRTVYSRKLDVLIISSKELVDTKLNFLSFVHECFSGIRVMVAFDNGLCNLHDVPDNSDIIMSNCIEDIAHKI